ncbi:hypothetical protein RFI_11989 [Reticulomyxa filosa]|uniref:Uncharacterized protein n=1 Tax=Reticulomyxa filosa TaxID=46433 RepID=X6NFQ6_RETFI|nr:hypothetical protein RFI_11989 [Reticulomyxa filosa]|eukprot:ETO25155.1 hypothetical protein RFI_11989 [Reticulomyxa filosa]
MTLLRIEILSYLKIVLNSYMTKSPEKGKDTVLTPELFQQLLDLGDVQREKEEQKNSSLALVKRFDGKLQDLDDVPDIQSSATEIFVKLKALFESDASVLERAKLKEFNYEGSSVISQENLDKIERRHRSAVFSCRVAYDILSLLGVMLSRVKTEVLGRAHGMELSKEQFIRATHKYVESKMKPYERIKASKLAPLYPVHKVERCAVSIYQHLYDYEQHHCTMGEVRDILSEMYIMLTDLCLLPRLKNKLKRKTNPQSNSENFDTMVDR